MRRVETPAPWSSTATIRPAFFEALLSDNMDLGRPENVELLFRRGQPAGPTRQTASRCASRLSSTVRMTWAAAGCPATCPSCRPRRVRSTTGCCTLKLPRRGTALVSQSLNGTPGPPSPAMGGRRPHCGSATFESCAAGLRLAVDGRKAREAPDSRSEAGFGRLAHLPGASSCPAATRRTYTRP
jgi:hypothetical protein